MCKSQIIHFKVTLIHVYIQMYIEYNHRDGSASQANGE